LSDAQVKEFENVSMADGIATLARHFPGQVVFSTSLGQEDQVILHQLHEHKIPTRIFTLDTGRLFNESYDLLSLSQAKYGERIEVFFPNHKDVENYAKENGVNGFYHSAENRKLCCHIRKVLPLNRALEGARVWITGLRADQSDNRKSMNILEWDEAKELYKYNPLLRWSLREVIDYLKKNKVPYNPLHDKGFISIGCAPCTRALEPGEDARAGRWWWETSHKECGLHEHQ